jgi:deoxyribodipyrimidine photolyase-related protein
MSQSNHKILRLILGDQLNIHHSWFKDIDDDVIYVMMELRSETDYVEHHIQKVIGFFAAMRNFAKDLIEKKHQVIYIKLNEKNNLHSFDKNCDALIKKHKLTLFEYQLPDEYRLDCQLKLFTQQLKIPFNIIDSQHFYGKRNELGNLFLGKKTFLMETFYRYMRKKNGILITDVDMPMHGKWNFDEDNRQKLPKEHKPVDPLVFRNDVTDIHSEINKAAIKTIGHVDSKNFIWPIDRVQSLQLYAGTKY